MYPVKSVIFKGCLFLFCGFCYAQQGLAEGHFMNNLQVINPAFVGISGKSSLKAFYSAQWLGIEGAPVTKSFNYTKPHLGRHLNAGLGIMSDQIGPTTQSIFQVYTAYTLTFSKNRHLTFGLLAGFQIRELNTNLLDIDQSQGIDPIFNQPIQNNLQPIIGAGLLFYKEDFFVGLGMPNFINTIQSENSAFLKSIRRTALYFNMGFTRPLSRHIRFRPTVILKAQDGASLQTNMTASFLIKNIVSLGVSYRLKTAVNGFFGYRFSDQLFIGLSYEKAPTSIGKYAFNSGSAAVLLSYEFTKLNKKTRKPLFIF